MPRSFVGQDSLKRRLTINLRYLHRAGTSLLLDQAQEVHSLQSASLSRLSRSAFVGLMLMITP